MKSLVELEGVLIAGKYRVKRRIGAGGMGAVYEGEHVEIGKRVAIKVIEHEHARSPELAARFRREARAASAVESDHIVQVFDVGQDETAGLYMVMEYLVGEDLSTRLEKNGGRIPVAEAVTIITQAARALGKAHAAGVVHRDLKPANLFLTTREDGSVSVKILDFGISKLVRPESDAKSSSLTREGSVIGTPMYMSPEQAQGLDVDSRSDIWSLASVLYEAIAGATPFEPRDTYEQMIVQIVTKKPRPIEAIAPWVPAPVARVIEAALEHDLATRTPDALRFARSLAESVRTPSAPSFATDATLPVGAPSSAEILASAASNASPPTNIGVVVGARAPRESSAPAKQGRVVKLAALGAALVGVVGIAFATREPARTPTAHVGLVESATAERPSASSAPSASASASAPVTTNRDGTSAQAASGAAGGSAAPAPSATSSSRTATPLDAGVRPAPGRPGTASVPPQPTATTTKGGPSQYGAAGVTTAY